MTRQVLIVNVTRMGDLVQMGTLLARLQEEWPGAAVDLVVDRRFAAVASLLTGLREIISFDFHALIDDSRVAAKSAVALYREMTDWAVPLVARRYDRIVNLTFNRPSALLCSYIGAPDIRGARAAWDGGSVIENGWMGYFTDMHRFRALNRFNLVDVYALGGSRPGVFAPLSVRVTPQATDWARRFLAAPPEAPTEWIAVQAGASDVMKAWRPQQFGQTLAQFIRRWAGGIVLIGTPAEQETIAQVVQTYRAAGGQRPLVNAAGKTSLEQLVGLLAECRLLLTNDTGPMHLAVGVKTPVIDLSVGHVDFRETGPHGPGHWVIQPELDCAPCGFDRVCGHQTCKDRIPTGMVSDLMQHVVGQGPIPVSEPGYSLYESGIDEDQLGTFRPVGGAGTSDREWYSRFWRRYWYELLTGSPSRIPADTGLPSDAEQAAKHVAGMLPEVEQLCRQAEGIVRAVSAAPSSLLTMQRAQASLRDRVVGIGLAAAASSPVTAVFWRAIHNDDVRGLDRMAQYHAQAYRQWQRHLTEVHRRLTRLPRAAVATPLPMARRAAAAYAG